MVCVLYIVMSSHLFWTSGSWTYRPGSHRRRVTQDFLQLPSAVIAFIFLARKIQPFLSLVDREVDPCVLTNDIVHHLGIFFVGEGRKLPVRVTALRFELTSQRQKSPFPDGVYFLPCDHGLGF